MTKKNVTIEDLAIMVSEGFGEMGSHFVVVEERLDKIEERLDNIEKMILVDHLRRIEKLERHVDELRDALAMK
jgi:hypothetical protein